MKTSQLTALLLVSLGVAACGESPKQSTDAPSQATIPVAAPTPAPTAAPIDNLVKNVVADGLPFQAEAAKVDGNALASTGTPGFVMYGPYVPFVAGNYRVNVKGVIAKLPAGSAIRFDVVSHAGTTVHAEHAVSTLVPAGNIAEFDVMIPEGVVDLELRAQVTEGVEMRIESYQITKAN